MVWGAFDPAEITRQLSLTPTVTRRRGDVLGVSTLGAREDTWRLVLGPTSTMDGTAQLEAMVDKIEPSASMLRALREGGATTGVVFVAYVPSHDRSAPPNMSLDHRLLARLAALGVDVTFDISLLAPDSDEDEGPGQPV